MGKGVLEHETSIMTLAFDDHNLFCCEFVNQPVFKIYSSTPVTGPVPLNGSGFPMPLNGSLSMSLIKILILSIIERSFWN